MHLFACLRNKTLCRLRQKISREIYKTEQINLANEKDLKIFSTILESGDYKNKFLFEAINKMMQKTKIRTYKNIDI